MLRFLRSITPDIARTFLAVNFLLSLLYVVLIVTMDNEFLELHISQVFSVGTELFVALTFVLVQTGFILYLMRRQYLADRPGVADLVKRGESDTLEFKSSLRWDYQLGKVNKELEHAVAKTVAGFLNTNGGILLIGVDDEKNILGLERDCATLKRKDMDGFVQQVSNVIRNSLGEQTFLYLTIVAERMKDHDVCRIEVMPSTEPVFITRGQDEEFYIRAANMTIALPVKQAYEYIQTRTK